MKVLHKENHQIYNVFDIVYDKTSYPHFLIFKDGAWIRMSAKHFVPMQDEVMVLTVDQIKDYLNNILEQWENLSDEQKGQKENSVIWAFAHKELRDLEKYTKENK